MNRSFQEILTEIPLQKLDFFTPIPQESIYYETVHHQIPKTQLHTRSICIIHSLEECKKLCQLESSIYIIQDINLVGIILCSEKPVFLQEEIRALFQKCQLPIVQIYDPTAYKLFEQIEEGRDSYRQLSEGLSGYIEKGFDWIATKLTEFLNTPLLFVDYRHHIVWEMGEDKELREAKKWLKVNIHELANDKYDVNIFSEADPLNKSFIPYCIRVHGLPDQFLIVSNRLVNWQRRFLANFIELTSLYIQTKGSIKGIQKKMKDDFLYDLFYHTFESPTMMVKKGKVWGWNLEHSHHLLVVRAFQSSVGEEREVLKDEMVMLIEDESCELEDIVHVISFDEQIVLLIEDISIRTRRERKKYVLQIAEQLERKLSKKWTNLQFKFGIGEWYGNSMNLNKSYQEGKLALQFGQFWFHDRNIFHFDDLGVLSLLIHIHQGVLSDFSEKHIGSLLEHDKEHHTEYVKTLEVYFQHHGKINEVAEELFIHPNTLRNRIRRIEEMTEMDLQDAEELSNIMIAVKIRSLIQFE